MTFKMWYGIEKLFIKPWYIHGAWYVKSAELWLNKRKRPSLCNNYKVSGQELAPFPSLAAILKEKRYWWGGNFWATLKGK